MPREEITIHSDGNPLNATLHHPLHDRGIEKVIVHCVGWMSSRNSRHYQRYYERLTVAGFAVLSFDYRGFGGGEPPASRVRFEEQLIDVQNVVEYAVGLGQRNQKDSRPVGLLGTGGAGAALGLQVAAVDTRVGAVAALWPIADGMDWLLSLRTPEQRRAFLDEIEKNALAMARGEPDRQVKVTDIVPRPHVRAEVEFKADIDRLLPRRIGLSTARSFRSVRPIDAVHRIAPRATLLIGCDRDVIVPFVHAQNLYDAARRPKKLVQLRNTTSYQAYGSHFDELSALLLDWFGAHLASPNEQISSWEED